MLSAHLLHRVDGEDDFDIFHSRRNMDGRHLVPVVSIIARDLVTIQVSIATLDNIFSIKGCLVDNHRTSIHPSTVYVVIYFQDW